MGNSLTRIVILFVFLSACCILSPLAAEVGSNAKGLVATRVGQEPVLDGDLSDSQWSQATAVSNFIQQEPAFGAEPS